MILISPAEVNTQPKKLLLKMALIHNMLDLKVPF